MIDLKKEDGELGDLGKISLTLVQIAPEAAQAVSEQAQKLRGLRSWDMLEAYDALDGWKRDRSRSKEYGSPASLFLDSEFSGAEVLGVVAKGKFSDSGKPKAKGESGEDALVRTVKSMYLYDNGQGEIKGVEVKDLVKRFQDMPSYYDLDHPEMLVGAFATNGAGAQDGISLTEVHTAQEGRTDPARRFFLRNDPKKHALCTLPFAYSCMQLFGDADDEVLIIFRADPSKAFLAATAASAAPEAAGPCLAENEQRIAEILERSCNVILHGAPGTGKTHLARKVAESLAGEDGLVEFVQFHPSYDYTDFVEGLRPSPEDGSSAGLKFEKRDGIFKEFVRKAQAAYQERGGEGNEGGVASEGSAPKCVFIIDEINRGEISKIFGELFFVIDPGYRVRGNSPEEIRQDAERKSVKTQYANMGTVAEEPFYIPENVYVIGTMNDIDRSVDSFDFAMRRRFRFVEVAAEDSMVMLEAVPIEGLPSVKGAMRRLNAAIEENANLGRDYQIGASYFMKLQEGDLDGDRQALWSDYLEPLLSEYLRGFHDKNEQLEKLKNAYENEPSAE